MRAWMMVVTAFLVIAAAGHAQEQRPQSQILTVVGEWKTTVQATIADVEVAVQLQGPTAVQVQRDIAKRADPVLSFLRELKAEKVQTGQYSVYPLYAKDQPNVIIGYRGQQTIRFRSSSDLAGKLVDAAVKAGANKVHAITLTPSDQDKREARELALIEASKQAMWQAEVVLQTLNLNMSSIMNIEIAPEDQPIFRPVALQARQYSEAKGTEVTPEQQQVQARIILRIHYQQ